VEGDSGNPLRNSRMIAAIPGQRKIEMAYSATIWMRGLRQSG
jgi:hypothetical protein